jgi:hypothetical protein
MVTVSHIVRKIVDERPFLQEAIVEGIVSYGSLAEKIKVEVEEELGKKVKLFSIVMALRRYTEKMKTKYKPTAFDFRSEIIMKTNLCDICFVKSTRLMAELKNLYGMVNFEKGDTLNVSHGNYEISIVTNEKYRERLLKYLRSEKILDIRNNLVSISLRYPIEFFDTPGVIFSVVRSVARESINIYEAISTHTELTLVIDKKDSIRAYKILQNMTES